MLLCFDVLCWSCESFHAQTRLPGDCFGCLRTFHKKRRPLDHLTRTKNPFCLNRIISYYALFYDAGDRAKYGRGASGSAVYLNGPPRDEDSWPIFVKLGRLLDVGCRSIAMGPSGLAFIVVPAVSEPVVADPQADVGFMLLVGETHLDGQLFRIEPLLRSSTCRRHRGFVYTSGLLRCLQALDCQRRHS